MSKSEHNVKLARYDECSEKSRNDVYECYSTYSFLEKYITSRRFRRRKEEENGSLKMWKEVKMYEEEMKKDRFKNKFSCPVTARIAPNGLVCQITGLRFYYDGDEDPFDG